MYTTKKRLMLFATMAAAILCAGTIVYAGGAQYMYGPIIEDLGDGSVRAYGRVAGLGKLNSFRVDVSATVTTTCTDGDGNSFTVEGTTFGSEVFFKQKGQAGGSTPFDLTTTPVEGACPSGNTEHKAASNESITVFDPDGNPIL